MRRGAVSRLLALVAPLLTAGCGDAAAGRAHGTVRDSAGIAIVENPSPDDSAANTWWSLDGPLVDIGGGGNDAHSLYRVTAALRLADGRIAVANNGSSELRYFTKDGVPAGIAGRAGEGPGEFRSLTALAHDGDSVLVFDFSLRRLSVYADTGRFVRSLQLGAESPAIFIARLPDGSIIGSPSLTGPAPPGSLQSGLMRPDQLFARYTADGQRLDSIGRFPGPERFVQVNGDGGRITSINISMPPFARMGFFLAQGPNLVVALQDSPEIRIFGEDGKLQRILRTGRAPQEVTPALVHDWIESMVRDLAPDQQQQLRTRNEGMPVPKEVPAYGEVRADSAGRLWVADYAHYRETAKYWTVYDREGRVQARLSVPDRFRPLDIGRDWVLGLAMDQDNVEHVQLFTIVTR